MRCPACDSEKSRIIDTRPIAFSRRRRRYECLSCGFRFNSIEYVQIKQKEISNNDIPNKSTN